ncbi:MAG: urea amidolyase family protein [Propionibacteriaceae bacterium]|jgi:KipI family sensor histidine kinase inhibitor|nr:urea amidolyase family protein [Propionibacteriaceae bacterium]
MDVRVLRFGADALLVELAGLDAALAAYDAISQAELPGVREIVPAARTVLVTFDSPPDPGLAKKIAALDATERSASAGAETTVPVCYDGEDLQFVASLLGIHPEEVIERHTGSPWRVAFSGFQPGFAYLVGGDPIFSNIPRLASPRVAVPAGAVGLARQFSAVYPRISPAGWQIIGRSPLPMWDTDRPQPATLAPGDTVRFQAVAEAPEPPTPQAKTWSDAYGLRALRPGLQASLQDDGRHALALGVSRSGAMDLASLHAANAAVGNAVGAPALEITFGNALYQSVGEHLAAVAGPQVGLTHVLVSGERRPVAKQPVRLADGDALELGFPVGGCRNYLAVAGGFAGPKLLGSLSWDAFAVLGPKPVTAGDLLATMWGDTSTTIPVAEWRGSSTLDVVLGPRDDWFTPEAVASFLAQEWEVTAESNRVGLRLRGEPLTRLINGELESEGMLPGAVQVPTGGQPVVFGRDHPVTGGYPVIAVLTPAAQDAAGQLAPGTRVKFNSVAG